MIVDEPLTPSTVEWIKKAIWQARSDLKKGEEVLSKMIVEHEDLRLEIVGLLLRTVDRQIRWDNQPMG